MMFLSASGNALTTEPIHLGPEHNRRSITGMNLDLTMKDPQILARYLVLADPGWANAYLRDGTYRRPEIVNSSTCKAQGIRDLFQDGCAYFIPDSTVL